MRQILVTGATGFVGRSVCHALAGLGFTVRAALHVERSLPEHVAQSVLVGDISQATDWGRALDGIDTVVHLAAKAHAMSPALASEQYQLTNAEGTEGLVRAAVRAGVRRFVYLSSIKVNGEGLADRAYTALDPPNPRDAYAISKWLGEKHVMEVEPTSPPARVIVRTPLVYGPGVRANFLRLLRWVEKGWPMPLGAIHNSRSMSSIWNLTHLLTQVVDHPGAAGKTWLVSDGLDLSTPELIARIGAVMGRRVRLLPVPVALLRIGGGLFGRAEEIARLCNSLTVDIAATRQQLAWSPALSVEESIRRTVRWYISGGGA